MCPHCGMAIERPPGRVPAWAIAIAVLLIALLLFVVF